MQAPVSSRETLFFSFGGIGSVLFLLELQEPCGNCNSLSWPDCSMHVQPFGSSAGGSCLADKGMAGYSAERRCGALALSLERGCGGAEGSQRG